MCVSICVQPWLHSELHGFCYSTISGTLDFALGQDVDIDINAFSANPALEKVFAHYTLA